jgi:membrane-bound ClpP family serine protease
MDYNKNMDIKPSLSAIRSIGAAFAYQLYLPIMIIVAVAGAILLALSIWLVTISEWWLILLILICGLILFATTALAVVLVIIKKVAPLQSKSQKKQTKAFVDKLLRVAEVTATPKFILLFQVMKDVVKPSHEGFISSVSNDTASLKQDFIALKNSFNS